MKAITKYQTDDGAEFHTEADALKYEDLCERVERAMEPLGPHPDKGTDGCAFSNGSGYLGHGVDVVNRVRNALLRLALEYVKHDWLSKSLVDTTVDASWAGRIIGECCPAPLQSAWYRISCCDKRGREWGQPYFAAHPGEGTQKDLKP